MTTATDHSGAQLAMETPLDQLTEPGDNRSSKAHQIPGDQLKYTHFSGGDNLGPTPRYYWLALSHCAVAPGNMRCRQTKV